MAALLKKLLIGTSVAVGMSAFASVPVQAAAFDFDNSENNYGTYTHNASQLWIVGNEAAAINALTDGDIKTNVELNFFGEKDDASVGFTAKAGKYTAKVSSVTDAEFLTFQDKWFEDLFKAYTPLQTVWSGLTQPVQALAKTAFTSFVGTGDVNVGEFSLDATGEMSMKTLGFLDLKPRVNKMIDDAYGQLPAGAKLLLASQVNSLKTALGQIDKLQISELAKVELNGKSEFVYSFKAENSGFVALDDIAGKSYSGVYSWSKAGTPAAVPEPSTMLGLMAVGGLFGLAKRNSSKKA